MVSLRQVLDLHGTLSRDLRAKLLETFRDVPESCSIQVRAGKFTCRKYTDLPYLTFRDFCLVCQAETQEKEAK